MTNPTIGAVSSAEEPRERDPMTVAGLAVVGIFAAALSALSLYHLALYAGWDRWLAPALPGVVNVYGVTTIRLFLGGRTRSVRVRTAAKHQAAVAVASELAGNALAHLLASQSLTLGHWRWLLVLCVALVPPAAVGGLAHLLALRAQDSAFALAENQLPQDHREDHHAGTSTTTRTSQENRREDHKNSQDRHRTEDRSHKDQSHKDQAQQDHRARTRPQEDHAEERQDHHEDQERVRTTVEGTTARTSANSRKSQRGKDQGARTRSGNVLAFDPQTRAEAVAAYRASVAAGKPLSERSLAARFGLSKNWARHRIAEARADAGNERADRRPSPTAADMAADARAVAEATAAYASSVTGGRPLSAQALADCYGKPRSWATDVIEAHDNGGVAPADRAEPVSPRMESRETAFRATSTG